MNARSLRALVGAVAVIFLAVAGASCSADSPDSAPQAGPTETKNLGIPTSAPLSGPEPGSYTTVNLPSGRSFILSVPKDYTGDKKWPIVLAFPGWGQSAGYSRLDAADAITIFAEGKKKAWSPAPYAKTSTAEDKKFVRDIIDAVRATYRVDDSRIFATGMSNGGGFAAYLACQMPDVFKSVATVSAAYYQDILKDCAHSPVGRLDIHGTVDPVVGYYGGTRHKTKYYSVESVLEQDRKRNGCSTKVDTTRLVNNALDMKWSGCTAPLEHIRIAGGSHVWPGGTADAHNEVGKFFATDRVLDFFGIPGRPSGTAQT